MLFKSTPDDSNVQPGLSTTVIELVKNEDSSLFHLTMSLGGQGLRLCILNKISINNAN